MDDLNLKSLLRIPFDQFSRQKIAYDFLNELRGKDESYTILDVGGYKGATSKFQVNDKVTILDLYDVNEKNYIKGDATAMEFNDASFDFVVSFDVLEHIPSKQRNNFLSECTRVAKRGVIVASPINTAENEQAEASLNNLYKKLHGKNHPWLLEHIENVIPKPNYTNSVLNNLGLNVEYLASNYTPLWIEMQTLIFAASKFDVIGSQIDDVYENYNSMLKYDGTEDITSNYRLVSIGLKSKKDSKSIKKFIDRLPSRKLDKETGEINRLTGEVFAIGLDKMFRKNLNLERKISRTKQAETEYKQLKAEVKQLRKTNHEILTSNSYKLSSKIAKVVHTVKPRKSK